MRRFIAAIAVVMLVGSLTEVTGQAAIVSSSEAADRARTAATFAAAESVDGGESDSVLHVAGARVARSAAAGNALVLPDAATVHLPENDHARGMVFDGLRPGPTGTPCDGSFEIRLGNGEVLCTHGPDPAPPGVDVRVPVEVHEDQPGDGTTAGEGGIACIGDGTDGNRVQAVYAVASDRTDRFAEVGPLISSWAGEVERVFAEGAARVGGERHVRFVTNPDCSLDVIRVEVSATGDDTINDTVNELWDLGYDRPDRKYLIWMDASVYCGVSPIYPDDSAGPSNLNNGGIAMYARVDSGCWYQSSSVAAHELVHSMGGVQPSAPHGTAGFHCSDERDRMCYRDGADVVLTQDCPETHEAHLDCNNDDYYHPDPAAGSYLADHWNVADSSFLHSGPVGSEPPPPLPPPPANEAPVVEAGPDAATEVAVPVALAGTVGDDGLPGESLSVEWTTIEGPGSATLGDTASAATTATFGLAGTYVLQLTAHDGELTSSDTTTVTVSEPPPPPPPDPDPIETTEVYSSSWNRKNPSRSYDVRADAGMFRATLVASSGSGGRGKKGRAPAPSPEVSITVTDQYGNVVEARSGAAPLTLSTDVLSGNYVVTVHGSAKTSFELTVTYMAP